MAKGKDGGNNNYTPIKNPELRPGEKETKTPKQLADKQSENVKKENETWVQHSERTKPKEPISLSAKYKTPVKDQGKGEPEKDKE